MSAGPDYTAVATPSGLAAAGLASRFLPEDPAAWSTLGSALRNLHRYDNAVTAHDTAIQLDSTNADHHNSRGITLSCLGRYDDALTAYDTAIQLDKTDPYYHHGRGNTGDHGRAAATLTATVPLRVPGDIYQPELYRLLDDPPLVGIDDIERIVAGTKRV